MRVAVMGGGAVGSLLASALSVGGNDVSIVQRRHTGVPARQSLVRIDPDESRTQTDVGLTDSPDRLPETPDLVVFAVKMFDLRAAAEAWSDWPGLPALTVQNGIGAEEMVGGLRPRSALIAAALTAPAGMEGAGVVRRHRTGGIGLAVAGGNGASLRDRLVHAFAEGGLPARAYDDAVAMKWSKLLGNLVGNATGALVDLDPAEIYAHPGLLDVERRQLLEAAAVVRRLGRRPVPLPGADVQWLPRLAALPSALSRPIWRLIVGGARGGKSPSLRVHVRSGLAGPSEVEWLNGAVARAGESTGVPTPVNRALLELVTEASTDPELARRLAGNPDLVAGTIADRAGPG